jgi:hypothetical protein
VGLHRHLGKHLNMVYDKEIFIADDIAKTKPTRTGKKER